MVCVDQPHSISLTSGAETNNTVASFIFSALREAEQQKNTGEICKNVTLRRDVT